MAFFKFRARGQKGDDPTASPAETIDDMRRRARHRLIGATVLVLVGVLGFPLLFDTQPRPIQVDIPIEIPDRDKARPPSAGVGGRVAAAPEAQATPPAVTADASLDAKEEVVADKAVRPAPAKAAPTPTPVPAAEAKVERKAEAKAESKAEPKAPPPADDGAKARALLDGKAGSKPAAPASAVAAAEQSGRYVVQVGAFADDEKARETRTRLERAGLKTYTQVVETKEGKRTRVRVGPYPERAEADKAADRIKGLSLPATVLSL